MRGCWIVAVAALAGCGFQLTITGDAPPADDAGMDAEGADATDADPPVDDAPVINIDAPWTAADCPATYMAIGTQPTRYRLLTNADDVLAHHNTCVTDGAHLAVVDTANEAAALRQFIDGTQGLPTISGYTLVYVGGVQRASQPAGAGWISATGDFNGSFWESGEPNDSSGNERFAVIFRNNNLLADVSNFALSALCECDGLEITTDYKTVLVDAAN